MTYVGSLTARFFGVVLLIQSREATIADPFRSGFFLEHPFCADRAAATALAGRCHPARTQDQSGGTRTRNHQPDHARRSPAGAERAAAHRDRIGFGKRPAERHRGIWISVSRVSESHWAVRLLRRARLG